MLSPEVVNDGRRMAGQDISTPQTNEGSSGMEPDPDTPANALIRGYGLQGRCLFQGIGDKSSCGPGVTVVDVGPFSSRVRPAHPSVA